ncbi:MAG: hypothetical protein K8H84_08080 [Sulfuricella denitrificans]|nr:hypothetical protein [Sulfuricella denitrificans]
MSNCELCGEPMPEGEEMFKYHGYSGDCPKPPLPKPKQKIPGLIAAAAYADNKKVSMLFYTAEQAHAFVAGIDADEPPNNEVRGGASAPSSDKRERP